MGGADDLAALALEQLLSLARDASNLIGPADRAEVVAYSDVIERAMEHLPAAMRRVLPLDPRSGPVTELLAGSAGLLPLGIAAEWDGWPRRYGALLDRNPRLALADLLVAVDAALDGEGPSLVIPEVARRLGGASVPRPTWAQTRRLAAVFEDDPFRELTRLGEEAGGGAGCSGTRRPACACSCPTTICRMSALEPGPEQGPRRVDEPGTGADDLRERALRVLHAAIERALQCAGPATLAAIVEADGPAEALLIAGRDVPPALAPALAAEVEAARRTAAFRRDLLERAGGALGTEAVRALLGWPSARAVRAAARRGRLLVVRDRRRMLFPAFQFVGGEALPGVFEVLAAAAGTSSWAVLQYLVEGDEGLGDDRAIDLLRGDRDDIDRVVRFAGKLAR